MDQSPTDLFHAQDSIFIYYNGYLLPLSLLLLFWKIYDQSPRVMAIDQHPAMFNMMQTEQKVLVLSFRTSCIKLD